MNTDLKRDPMVLTANIQTDPAQKSQRIGWLAAHCPPTHPTTHIHANNRIPLDGSRRNSYLLVRLGKRGDSFGGEFTEEDPICRLFGGAGRFGNYPVYLHRYYDYEKRTPGDPAPAFPRRPIHCGQGEELPQKQLEYAVEARSVHHHEKQRLMGRRHEKLGESKIWN